MTVILFLYFFYDFIAAVMSKFYEIVASIFRIRVILPDVSEKCGWRYFCEMSLVYKLHWVFVLMSNSFSSKFASCT